MYVVLGISIIVFVIIVIAIIITFSQTQSHPKHFGKLFRANGLCDDDPFLIQCNEKFTVIPQGLLTPGINCGLLVNESGFKCSKNGYYDMTVTMTISSIDQINLDIGFFKNNVACDIMSTTLINEYNIVSIHNKVKLSKGDCIDLRFRTTEESQILIKYIVILITELSPQATNIPSLQ